MTVSTRTEKRKLAILEILKKAQGPLSSREVTDLLNARGFEISERTVRLHLQGLDAEGLTESCGKKGRMISETGRKEIGGSKILERVGFMSSRIDEMSYRMSFDLARRSGTVVVNTTVVRRDILMECLDEVCRVFELGYAMGSLIGLIDEGESLEDISIPKGFVGICTVCSVTLNGVLLKHGVPVRSLFCGLLELKDHKPLRLAEVINYDGTSLDPLELFIRGGKTQYLGAISNGCGCIGIGFRELPADSYDLVLNLAEKLKDIGLGAFMEIGRPAEALYNVPVHDGCIGAIVVGGLNPMAVFEEKGYSVEARALSGLVEFNRLHHYSELHGLLKS